MDNRMMDTTKLCYHKDAIENYFIKNKRVAPIHLDIGLSKECQIRCRFCYGFFQNIKRVHIQHDPLMQLIKDASEIGVKSIAAIGDGEPLMNPHAIEFFNYARDFTKIDMAISTNGIALNTDEKCEALLSSCKWLRFCICAGTREGYLKIHQKDYFDKVVAHIKRLIVIKAAFNYKCDVGLQAVYIPGLMNQNMLDMSKLAVDLGVNYVTIKQCSLPDSGESGMEFFDLNKYDSKETEETLDRCEAMSTQQTQITAKRVTMKRKGFREYTGCLSVPFISEFSGDGSWYPCGFFFGDKPEHLKYCFGNIHQKSLKEIWKSECYWNVIQLMKNFNVHMICKGACRLDCTNKFCYDYLNGKEKFKEASSEIMGINFI